MSHLCFPSCFRDFTQNHCPNGRPKSIERKNWTPIDLKNEKTQFNSKTNQNKSNPLNLSQSDPNSTSTTHRLKLNHLKSSRGSILKFLVLPPGHLHPAVKGSMTTSNSHSNNNDKNRFKTKTTIMVVSDASGGRRCALPPNPPPAFLFF